MSALIPAQPILENRLGKEAFDPIPQQPGVYRFYDQRGELLYVGKAKNLRRRLFGYKRARAGQVSRKVARLIGLIGRLEWEVTETEQKAFLLENRLIRGERPPFNHANKQTEAYYFVYLKPDQTGLEFRLAMRIHDETDPASWYGCFKGHAPVRRSLGCLLQLLWMAEMEEYNPLHLPVQLTRRLTPIRFRLPWRDNSPLKKDDAPGLLHHWLLGESCELLDWLAGHIKKACPVPESLFQARYIEHHLECLQLFYEQKLVRHKNMRNGQRRLGQEEIDDAIIVNRGTD
ncbi:MAG: nucleotide excision repair endonuclease [Balneolaceae bacterium]